MDPPLEWGYRLQPVSKQCSLVVLPNSGLLAPLESPMQVAEALIKELDPTIRIYKRVFFYDLTREPLQHLIRSHLRFHL